MNDVLIILHTVELEKIRKFNDCHDEQGKFCEVSGGGVGTASQDIGPRQDLAKPVGTRKLTKTSSRAWTGQTVELKTSMSKLETGELGESIVISYLKSQGFKDAGSLNIKGNNFPIDLVQDHEVIEVKTGLVSNGSSAQFWRATIGQPGKKEREWLKTASKEAKAKFNAKKQAAILDRKNAAVKEVSQKLGRPVKPATMTMILNPDKKTVDLYKFDGFHLMIRWKSNTAQKSYVGSFKYA